MGNDSIQVSMADTASTRVVFIWATSPKHASLLMVKRMFGGDVRVMHMKPGTTVQTLTDEDLAAAGLRRVEADHIVTDVMIDAGLAALRNVEGEGDDRARVYNIIRNALIAKEKV